MNSAKNAVKDFISRDGKHQTTYDENVNKAVTDEHVRHHEHENVTTAIDKEIHQDHHHTIVQPIKAKETMAEKHTHQMAPVEHKTFHHGNERELRTALDSEQSKYTDSSVVHEATHSSSTAGAVVGEHVHHHVHEHVQPVIHKDTIVPHVVHTTVPIHETHHAEAVHHGTTTLPAKTLTEFMSDKGTLEGRSATKLAEYDGRPKPYNKELQNETLAGDGNMHARTHDRDMEHSHSKTHQGTGIGLNDTSMRSRDNQQVGSGTTLRETSLDQHDSRHTHIGSGTNVGDGLNSSDTTQKKLSLVDKLNPFTDANGDGQKGFMK